MATKTKLKIKPKAIGAKDRQKLSVSAMRSRQLNKNLPKLGGGGVGSTELSTRMQDSGLASSGEIDPAAFMGVANVGVGLIDAFARPDELGQDFREVNINEGARAGKGALKGAAAGMALGPIGAGVGAVAGALSGFFGGKKEEKEANIAMNERLNKFRSVNRMSTMTQSPTYMPVAKQGGYIAYKGETHKGPNGGILVDEQGNPTGQKSFKTPVALTEKNEVSRFDPTTGSTYIYSDSLKFAKPALSLLRKHELDKPDSLKYLQYKNDPLTKEAVDRQFENLTTAQEFTKETKTPTDESLGMFGKGGSLTASKAKRMLEDGTANKKPLTAKQKRYFGWIVGGKKEFGGDLPKYETNGLLPEDPESVINISGNTGWRPNIDVNLGNFLEYEKNLARYHGTSFLAGAAALGNAPITAIKNVFNRATGRPTISRTTTGEFYNQLNRNNSPTTNYSLNSNNADTAWMGRDLNGTTFDEKTGKFVKNLGKNITEGLDIKLGNTNIQSNLNQDFRVSYGGGSGTGRSAPGMGINTNRIGGGNPAINPRLTSLNSTTLATRQPSIVSQSDSVDPWLNPAGHLLSAAGNIADYAAMRRAKPEDVNLPRVGAERIDLSRQRLINTRQAEGARSTNVANTRRLGVNAGATFSTLANANTGVSRLLGEQNMQSLMAEESTNAQMQQQANLQNAQLGAEEEMMNTQNQNAYRAAMARLNPAGNIARTAASYFADNAAYQQGYDTMQMLAPNAELYGPNKSWIDRFKTPKVRLRDK